MEVNLVAQKIEEKIKQLEKLTSMLKDRAEAKAKTSAEYDKQMALVIVKIRNKAIKEYEGFTLDDLPANLLEKIAKGICYQARLDMDIGKNSYKSLITAIETTRSILNGWQSVNRYLSEEV